MNGSRYGRYTCEVVGKRDGVCARKLFACDMAEYCVQRRGRVSVVRSWAPTVAPEEHRERIRGRCGARVMRWKCSRCGNVQRGFREEKTD